MRELKRYKEELVALVLLSLLLLAVRWLSVHYWSGDVLLDAFGNPLPGEEGKLPGLYDLRSETETIAWTILRMVIYSLFAWLGVRVTMPSAYKWLKDQFDFGKLDGPQKVQMVFRLFAIMFFGLVLLHASGATGNQRECVIASARADLGVRELTGNNDGPRIEEYQRHVKAPLRSSWCVAMVSFHLSACGVENPKSAWSPAYSADVKRVWTPRKELRRPLPADVFTLYYPHLGRVGHGGFVEVDDGRYIKTIEGNTSGGGSRDGDGMYARRRELSKVHAITNYINDDAHRSALAGRAGHGQLQASAHTGTLRGAARQRGGAVHAARQRGVDRARFGARACAHRQAEDRDEEEGPSHNHAARERGAGHGHLCMRQRGHQGASVGQVDQAELFQEGGGAAHQDDNAHAQVGMVGTARRGCLHLPRDSQAAAHDHACVASVTCQPCTT